MRDGLTKAPAAASTTRCSREARAYVAWCRQALGRRCSSFALAAVLLLLPRAAAATPRMAELAQAWRLLDSYRVAQGRELLDQYLKDHPEHQAARYYRALAAFYEGNYAEAAERLAKVDLASLGLADPDLPRLCRDTAAATASLATMRSEHFTLLLDDRKDWILARTALETLETCYRSLGDFFDLRPPEPVRVEIYAGAEAFQKVSSLTVHDIEGSGAVGICKFNKIMMLSPRTLAFGYRWRDTLTHEYLHYLVVCLTANQAPVWVQEGVAKYLETYWKTGRFQPVDYTGGALLARALREGGLIPFDAMDPSLVRLDTPEQVTLAFAECSTAVDFIVAHGGTRGLRDFLRRIGEREPGRTREALQETVGLEFPAFEEAWKTHLAGLGLKIVEHLRVDRHKLAGGEGDEELLADISSQAARNYLRLGDSLRKAGRPKPALVEYQRACRESPDSPYLLNKVAITALMLEDFTLAAEYGGKALEISPDYPLSYLTLGDLALKRERWLEALGYYDEYNEINPYNPLVWRMKGMAHRQAGDARAARAAWETALRLEPDNEQLRRELEALGQ